MPARAALLGLALLAAPVRAGEPAVEQPWWKTKLELEAQPLANPSGGRQQSASWMQQLTLDLELGPGLNKPPAEWREGDHWRGHVELSLFSGQPDWGERIGAAFPLQATASPNGLWLSEASVERRPGTGSLGLKAGLFSLDPDWVTAPVLNAYVHSALDNALNLNVQGVPLNPAVASGSTCSSDRAGAGAAQPISSR